MGFNESALPLLIGNRSHGNESNVRFFLRRENRNHLMGFNEPALPLLIGNRSHGNESNVRFFLRRENRNHLMGFNEPALPLLIGNRSHGNESNVRFFPRRENRNRLKLTFDTFNHKGILYNHRFFSKTLKMLKLELNIRPVNFARY